MAAFSKTANLLWLNLHLLCATSFVWYSLQYWNFNNKNFLRLQNIFLWLWWHTLGNKGNVNMQLINFYTKIRKKFKISVFMFYTRNPSYDKFNFKQKMYFINFVFIGILYAFLLLYVSQFFVRLLVKRRFKRVK